MAVSTGEKIIIALLCDIKQSLGSSGGIDASLLSDVIDSDDAWGASGDNPDIINYLNETLAIMTMWFRLRQNYRRLVPSEKEQVDGRWSRNDEMAFPGFQGIEGPHMFIAEYLSNAFGVFKDMNAPRDFDGHAPALGGYKRMLQEFERMGRPHQLSVEDITEILDARQHPTSRPS